MIGRLIFCFLTARPQVNAVVARERAAVAAAEAALPPLPPEAAQMLREARAEAATQLKGQAVQDRPAKRARSQAVSGSGQPTPAQAELLRRVVAECQAANSALAGRLQLSARPDGDSAVLVTMYPPGMEGSSSGAAPTSAAVAGSAAAAAAPAAGLDPAWQVALLRVGSGYPRTPPSAVLRSGAKAPAGRAAELARQCRMCFAAAAAAAATESDEGVMTLQATAAVWADAVAGLRAALLPALAAG